MTGGTVQPADLVRAVVQSKDAASLDTLIDLLADRIATRLAELLGSERPSNEAHLVDAEAIASALGVSRAWVYEHADELGARRLGEPGPGRPPRLRFELARALEAWAARSAGESGESNASDATAKAPTSSRRSRRSGANSDLLPIRGGRR